MPAGFHKYPFTFSLPPNIPCSFEHAYGHIRYTMKAVIDRPWRFNHECKIAFTVVSSYDLNIHSQQCVSKINITKVTCAYISFILILSKINFAMKLQNDDTQNNIFIKFVFKYIKKYVSSYISMIFFY